MAFDLIQINEFPQVSQPEDWIVVSDAAGTGYKISKEDFKEWLGTVTVITDKPIALSDPAPTMDGVYLPTEPGTYTNAGGLVYDPEGVDAGKYVQFIKDDAVWTKLALDLPQAENKIPGWEAGTYEQGDQRIWNGQIWSVDVPSTTEEPGTGADWIPDINLIEKSSIGINTFAPNELNIIEPLYGTDRNDSSIWTVGYITATGQHAADGGYRYPATPLPIAAGSYRSNIYLAGNAAAVVKDSAGNVLQSFTTKGNVGGTVFWEFTVPDDAFFVFSYAVLFDDRTDDTKLEFRTLYNTTQINEVTGDVFVLSSEVDEIVKSNAQELLDKYGISPTPIGTNFIPELTGSDIADLSIWEPGRLNENNEVLPEPDFYYSVKSYPLPAGTYSIYLFFRGTAKSLILEEDGETVRQVLDNQASGDGNFSTVTISTPARLRVSHRQREDQAGRTNDIFAKNTSLVYEPIGSKSSSTTDANILIKKTLKNPSRIKTKFPMVTFISDDGFIHNDDWYIPTLDNKGIKSTFAIITGLLGTDPSRFWDWNRVVDLYKDGHDIAGHTHTHRNMLTGYLDVDNNIMYDEIDKDLMLCKTALNGRIAEMESPMFIAPQGARNVIIDRLVRKWFKTDFITINSNLVPDGNFMNLPPIDSYFINRVSFDAIDTEPNPASTLPTCKAAVDKAILEGGWVVFAVHPQYNQYQAGSNPTGYVERRQDLADLIDYIQGLDVPIVPANRAYDLYGNIAEIGNRRLDDPYYVVGMDGSEQGAFYD